MKLNVALSLVTPRPSVDNQTHIPDASGTRENIIYIILADFLGQLPYEHGSRALCLAHWKDKIVARKTSALAM